jgi:hypothetical protein
MYRLVLSGGARCTAPTQADSRLRHAFNEAAVRQSLSLSSSFSSLPSTTSHGIEDEDSVSAPLQSVVSCRSIPIS